jgi:hypothetical protein
MTDSPVVAALAICAIWLAGMPLARLLGMRGALFVATSWLFGGAALTLLMLLAGALHAPLTRPVLAFCWCIAMLVPLGLAALVGHPAMICNYRARPPTAVGWQSTTTAAGWRSNTEGMELRRDPPRAGGSVQPRVSPVVRPYAGMARFPGLLDVPALAVCLFQVAFVLLQSVRVPLGSFDTWSLWEYKGRRFWLDGGITGGFLHDHAAIFAHPAYPPLVSLLIAWVYTWLGAADPTLMKPLFAAFYAALLLAFFGALRPRLGPRGALLTVAALSLVPRIVEYAGTGLADVPLAAALVASAAALVRWHEDGDGRALTAAGALLGVALLIKHDALFFGVAALIAAAAMARSWRPPMRLGAIACLIGAPWYIYVRVTGVPDRDFLPLTIHNLIEHASRIGTIARLFAFNLLAANEWSVLWYAFAALLVAGLVGRRLRASLLLVPVLLPLALYVLSLSLSAWPDYMLHVRTSLDRLILVTTPFALWFIAEQLRPASTSYMLPISTCGKADYWSGAQRQNGCAAGSA